MKAKDKILNYEQAKELKWFCKNILGTRQEFYSFIDEFKNYKLKIDRLSKQAEAIINYCETNGIKFMDDTEDILNEVVK